MLENLQELLIPAGKIIWINLLLSGDNAVVIALACRGLPPGQRGWGIALGAGAAILLRIIFTLMTTQIMNMPWLKAVGALALLWIGAKLVVPEEASEDSVAGHDSLWKAVQTVAIADVVMSFDNVIAIAGAADAYGHLAIFGVDGRTALIIFGLLVSIPMVIAGSTILMAVIDRFPILVWAGAALLGWIAGELFAKDGGLTGLLSFALPELPLKIGCALLVLALGYFLKKRHDAAHGGVEN